LTADPSGGRQSITSISINGLNRSRGRSLRRKEWLAAREAELLPVPYYHVVFTLPAAIADIAYQNKAVIYDLLFKASAETLITIAADTKHLGARVGVLSVLHTWGSALTHPHVHMIVPGGGISLYGTKWRACRPGFFLPVRVLSRLSRRRFLDKLIAAYQAGQLQFFGNHAPLIDAQAFAAYLAPLRDAEWVVYAKRPFGGPKAVLAYLARYTHRVAISNSRLIALNDNGITFKWKDYRIEGPDRYKVMTLETTSSSAGSSATCCRLASTASAITACSPTPPAPTTSREHASCSPGRCPATMPPAARRRHPAYLPMLWRTHDHHRDLRTRPLAAISTDSDGRNQHRHLMMPLTYPPSRSAARCCGWCSTSHGSARLKAALAPQLASQIFTAQCGHNAARPTAHAPRRHRPAHSIGSSTLQRPTRSPQIPIACERAARSVPSLPRFPPLKVFVTPGPQTIRRHHHGPASENLYILRSKATE
jgi:Putative transposase